MVEVLPENRVVLVVLADLGHKGLHELKEQLAVVYFEAFFEQQLYQLVVVDQLLEDVLVGKELVNKNKCS